MILPGDTAPENCTAPSNTIGSAGLINLPVYHYKKMLLPISNLYNPQINDILIVKALKMTADFIKCQILNNFEKNTNIDTGLCCYILSLSFYNVTKRNKPKIKMNEILLVRVVKIKGDFVLVSAKEEWLGQIDKLVEKYEQEKNLKDSEEKSKLLFSISPVIAMNIFMTGIEISDTFVCVGMNGAVFLWGKNVVSAEKRIKKEYQGIL